MDSFKVMIALVDWKDVGVRAGKTFLQAALAYVITAFSTTDVFSSNVDKAFWTGLILSTLAAGASATWNGVVKPALIAWKEKLTA